ncbi:hypothetical protein BBJ28_00004043 [Nothophytophthora sp. Chile5]|nr:hypothetical protein BBJ28_00004043 [Nothophytophthora sp. Chile5]
MPSTPLTQESANPSPQVNLTDGEALAFRHLAHSIVSRTLAHECEYHRLGRPELADADWKVLKRQNELRIYKRRSRATSEADQTRTTGMVGTPNVLCVGSVEGSLEDIMNGMHSKNREEMSATASFLHNSHMDCAVLAVLEKGSESDPFRQLALKWFISETFGDARLVNHRDMCTLESTGIRTDPWGQSYGYFLAKSVDLSGCPPMPESSDVVRAKMTMCCIYRQAPGARVVDVYAKGTVDLGGDLPAFLTYNASCTMMFSIAVAMESGEAKRLTLLALQHAKRSASSKPELEAEAGVQAPGTSLSASYYSTSSSNFTETTTPPSLLSSMQTKEGREPRSQKLPVDPCWVCGRKPAMAKLVRASHRRCGICSQRVCSKCHVKRRLIARPHPVTVACCKVCILAAKRLSVDPRDPCPILP